MRPFRWQQGRLVTSIEPHEAALLRQAVAEIRDLLREGDSTGASSDRLPANHQGGGSGGASSGGLPANRQGGRPEAEPDPVRERLLPDGHRSDPQLATDYRLLTETGLRAEKQADATLLLDTVTDAGGRVELDENGAEAWLRAINDVRLAVGVRLDVQETDDPSLRAEQTGDPRWAAYSWLTAVQGLLIDALLTGQR